MKQSITGYGRATKEEIRRMLPNLVNNFKLNNFPDATDALAIAYCHIVNSKWNYWIMIAYLKGKVIKKNLDHSIIDVNGIGYLVFMPLSTLTKIEINSIVELNISTIVRENSFELYGFLTEDEQKVFKKLITVPKIGAKLACMILSGMSVEKIINAVKEKNVYLLSSIPGIGKKTAERICIDLKDKFEDSIEFAESHDLKKDLESALINLGFKKNEIEKVVSQILKKYPDEKIENLLKYALNELYK